MYRNDYEAAVARADALQVELDALKAPKSDEGGVNLLDIVLRLVGTFFVFAVLSSFVIVLNAVWPDALEEPANAMATVPASEPEYEYDHDYRIEITCRQICSSLSGCHEFCEPADR
jgi:hypothetical protein